MRVVLTFALGGLTLATGIVTALVQSNNYERARHLAELQRSWENLEAINVQREARAAAHVVAFEDEVLGRSPSEAANPSPVANGARTLEGVQ